MPANRSVIGNEILTVWSPRREFFVVLSSSERTEEDPRSRIVNARDVNFENERAMVVAWIYPMMMRLPIQTKSSVVISYLDC